MGLVTDLAIPALVRTRRAVEHDLPREIDYLCQMSPRIGCFPIVPASIRSLETVRRQIRRRVRIRRRRWRRLGRPVRVDIRVNLDPGLGPGRNLRLPIGVDVRIDLELRLQLTWRNRRKFRRYGRFQLTRRNGGSFWRYRGLRRRWNLCLPIRVHVRIRAQPSRLAAGEQRSGHAPVCSNPSAIRYWSCSSTWTF